LGIEHFVDFYLSLPDWYKVILCEGFGCSGFLYVQLRDCVSGSSIVSARRSRVPVVLAVCSSILTYCFSFFFLLPYFNQFSKIVQNKLVGGEVECFFVSVISLPVVMLQFLLVHSTRLLVSKDFTNFWYLYECTVNFRYWRPFNYYVIIIPLSLYDSNY
jgi:hypothetical protein